MRKMYAYVYVSTLKSITLNIRLYDRYNLCLNLISVDENTVKK